MSAVSSDPRPATPPDESPLGSYDRGAMATRGVRAGLVAGVAMIAWIMFCGETASAVTPVAGVRSSTWTGITAVTGVFFGASAVHGSFHVLSILFGLAVLLALSAGLGAVGALAVAETVGPGSGPAGAVLIGLAVALAAVVLLINIVANAAQNPDVLYQSIPAWGWLVAAGTYGSVFGLRLARLGRLARERGA